MDRFILDTRGRTRSSTRSAELHRGRSRRHCSASSSTATGPEDLPPRLDAARAATCAREDSATTSTTRIDPAAQARIWKLARSGAGPVDGREGGRQGDLVRRRHGRRAGAAARLHRRFLAHRQPARHDGRRLRPRLGRLPARAAGGQPEDRGGRAAVRGDRRRSRRPGARVRRRAVGRAWRRPGAQPVHEKMFGPMLVRGLPRASSGRSTRTASSTPARSSTPRR